MSLEVDEMALSLKIKSTQTTHVVSLKGELAFDTVGALKNYLDGLPELNRLPVVLDMSEVEFVDSKGAGFIVQLNERLSREGLFISELQPQIKEIFRRLFLLERLKVFKKTEEAVNEAPGLSRSFG